MMFLALVVGGLLSFPKLGVQNQPDISFPFVTVSVAYAGVPPSQMETEVTRKIEDAVSTIVGIEHVTSTVEHRQLADQHRVPVRPRHVAGARRRA